MPTTTATATPHTITLPEGQVLHISGSTGAADMVCHLDPAPDGSDMPQSWAIGAGTLAAIGPFAGQRRFLVTCTAASASAGIQDATRDAPIFSPDAADMAAVRQATGGLIIGMGGIQAPLPSGDLSGATDAANLNATITRAAAGFGRMFIRKGAQPYIVNQTLVGPENLHIDFEPGAVIQVRDKAVVASSWTGDNCVVSVEETSGIQVGMQVSDGAADLQAGNPFGAIQYGTSVVSVSAACGPGCVVLSKMPTTMQPSPTNLNFHPRVNIFTSIARANWSLTCAGGWATLDGNWTHAYPYNYLADDTFRNCLRIVDPTDARIDGIICAHAYFHGGIVVGKVTRFTVGRFRGFENGYRALHMHGESTDGGTTWPEVRDNSFGDLETYGGGHRCFYNRGGDELSGGFFLIYSNVTQTIIKSVRARNELGFGFHASGGTIASGSLPNFPSKHLKIGPLFFEDCGTGLELDNSLEFVDIGPFTAIGAKKVIADATTIDAVSMPKYSVGPTGVLASVKSRRIQVPPGQVAASGVRPGHRVFMSGSNTGAPTYGLVVWEVDAVADTITVFNQEMPGKDPYTVVHASAGMALYVRGVRDGGIGVNTPAGTRLRSIKFSSISMENAGRYGIQTAYSATQARMVDVNFGRVSITGCTCNALYLGSLNGFTFDSFHERNNGSGFDAGSVSGAANSYFVNCSNGTINAFSTEHDAPFNANQAKLRIDADCRNITIFPRGMKRSAMGATIECLVTAGAPANASGVSGPVVLINPTASDGTPLTVAGGHIIRQDAASCVITRPVDAP